MEYPEDQIRALANPMRIEILRLLKSPETHFPNALHPKDKRLGVNITTLAQHFRKTEPTMSRHIELLARAKFIKRARRINRVYCRRDEASIQKYFKWIQKTVD